VGDADPRADHEGCRDRSRVHLVTRCDTDDCPRPLGFACGRSLVSYGFEGGMSFHERVFCVLASARSSFHRGGRLRQWRRSAGSSSATWEARDDLSGRQSAACGHRNENAADGLQEIKHASYGAGRDEARQTSPAMSDELSILHPPQTPNRDSKDIKTVVSCAGSGSDWESETN
jgi:hypothetical protein